MTLIEILSILSVHYISDFILQTNNQARNKAESLWSLVSHTTVYSLSWILFCYAFELTLITSIWFILITFVAHTITDYITSKITKKLWVQLKSKTILYDDWI